MTPPARTMADMGKEMTVALDNEGDDRWLLLYRPVEGEDWRVMGRTDGREAAMTLAAAMNGHFREGAPSCL